MDLQNGYKVMYEARERITEEKPGPLYASKGIPALTDAMLISYNNGAAYVDCKQFKLIYSDGKHLFGSVSGIPAANDVNIVIKAGNEIVFGEVIGNVVEDEVVEDAVVENEIVEDEVVEEELEEEHVEDEIAE